MISSASLLLLVLGAGPADSLPPAVAMRVQELIGARWSVAPDSIHLEAGRVPGLPAAGEGLTLRLSGSGHLGWFVVTLDGKQGPPVAITLRAGVQRLRPVAARPLVPGTRLQAGDIAVAEAVVWGAPQPDETGAPALAEGWEVRRALRRGDPLVAPAVQPPRLVVSGQPVVFVWARGPIWMERVAIAQGSARLGERVHGQVGAIRLRGIVTGPRTVLIEQEVLP